MGKCLIFFLFAFLFCAGILCAQSAPKSNQNPNYVDSATIYFEKCLNKEGVDSTVLAQVLEFIYLIDWNQNNIDQIDNIAEDLERRNMPEPADIVMESLINSLAGSEHRELAINYLKNIIDSYNATGNPNKRITALNALLAIRIPLREKNLSEAFDYYTSGLKTYLGKNDSMALSLSYFCLGSCYRLLGLPDMTIYNFKKSISYLNKNDLEGKEPISGLYGYMNHISVLGQLYLEIEDYPAAISYSMEAKDIRKNVLADTNYSFLNGNIALAKLNLNDLDGVDELLNDAIRISTQTRDYPSLVRSYEIMGMYFMATDQLDSAEYHLLKCKEVMQIYNINHFSAAGIHLPNYHLAKIRISQKRYKEARDLLEEELVQIAKLNAEVLKEQKLLIEVYLALGDTKAADSTFQHYSELQKFMRNEDRKNRSKSYEVELKIEEAESTIKELETEKMIADITKKYLIGIAVILLIVSVIIFNRFRVTRKQKIIIEKEKLRSEELLLNILPAEVAEELKEKGSAEAKQFDQVTVMFTDFKGFTQLSEKLTPAELVAEIDYCFKAFDQIVTRHNIEKIKTIGDAYMCAGGLPVANATHAADVVLAAIEIQDFIRKHHEQSALDGKEVFEIRIGVHTGQVVAGIVGVKKFAYDIWGDTVNIASRMESSGEVGKVNISGTTYEQVKDKFICTHRGRIYAKGKGEIDMYFVEGEN